MDNKMSKTLRICSWVFVWLCMRLAIISAVSSNILGIAFLVAAIGAMPLVEIRDLWVKLLHVHEVSKPEEITVKVDENLKFYQVLKKRAQEKEIQKVQEQNQLNYERYQAEEKSQKFRMKYRPIILSVLFLCGLSGFAQDDAKSKEIPTTTNVASVEKVEVTPQVEEVKPTPEPSAEVITTLAVETQEPVNEKEEIQEDSTFSVLFIDVGQADAALVECDGHYMLIDGGEKNDSQKIYTILKDREVEKLDIVVGTHPHADHIGGIPGAYNYTNADLTLCTVEEYDSEDFADFKKYADSNGNGITIPPVGNQYELGSAIVDVIGINGGSEVNDTSIILKVTYGKTSFLFMADAEKAAEQTLLDSGADLSATVLKVGHHGSENATSEEFLKQVHPFYAVISVGKNNPYFHPTETVLKRLSSSNLKIFRTDLNGDILMTSNGEMISVTTEKTAEVSEILTAGGHEETAQAIAFEAIAATEQETMTRSFEETQPQEAVEPEQEWTAESEQQYTYEEPVEETPVETYQEPVGTDYIANTNTGKFHYPWCSSAQSIKEHNRMYFTGTRQDLIDMGYQACKRCNP